MKRLILTTMAMIMLGTAALADTPSEEVSIRQVLANFAQAYSNESVTGVVDCLYANNAEKQRYYSLFFNRVQIHGFSVVVDAIAIQPLFAEVACTVVTHMTNPYIQKTVNQTTKVTYILRKRSGTSQYAIMGPKSDPVVVSTEPPDPDDSWQLDSIPVDLEDPMVTWKPFPGALKYTLYMTTGEVKGGVPATYLYKSKDMVQSKADLTEAIKQLGTGATEYNVIIVGKNSKKEIVGIRHWLVTLDPGGQS